MFLPSRLFSLLLFSSTFFFELIIKCVKGLALLLETLAAKDLASSLLRPYTNVHIKLGIGRQRCW